MTGPVAQYERFDLPGRLFLMTTRMKGLPVAVLHDFDRDQATMRVRLAGLINVVLQHRPTSASGSAARQNGVTSTGRYGPRALCQSRSYRAGSSHSDNRASFLGLLDSSRSFLSLTVPIRIWDA
jgi:hypothetical protein